MGEPASHPDALRVLVLAPEGPRRQALLTCLEGDPFLRPLAAAGTLVEALDRLSRAGRGEVDLLVLDADLAEVRHARFWALLRLLLPRALPILAVTEGEEDALLEFLLAVGVAGPYPAEAGPEEVCEGLRRVAVGETAIHPRLAERVRLRLALPAEEVAALGPAEAYWDGERGELVFRGRRVRLTPREREVLRLLGQGLSNKEIAHRLGVSRRTVEFHVENLLRKTELGSRLDAALLGRALWAWRGTS